ncbi:MAG: ATP synthase F1 subunit gamma [Acidobacteriota bacterium]
MASTRDLRRKIRSVKNTSQLTKAMKMVSAAKLRRAQEAMLAARPYSQGLRHVLSEIGKRAKEELHPLLASRPEKTVDLVVVAGDKGLCGAFNANVVKLAEKWRKEKEAAGVRVVVTVVGRKAAEFYRRRPQIEVRESLSDFFRGMNYIQVRDIAERLQARFVAGETDAVYLCFNEFRTVASQTTLVRPLLPLNATNDVREHEATATEYVYEPDAESLLGIMLPRHVSFQLWQALLESTASEHGARMAAMDSATRNANEVIAKLTLKMNRVRQAAITTEIIEVVSGADALA